MKVCAIIVAAGRGQRMGTKIFKQFLEIENKPILAHTLEKFCQSELIDSIIVVIPKSWYHFVVENIIDKYNFTKVTKIQFGGSTRQDSVYKALKSVSQDTITVVIHDAVRPFVSQNLLQKVIHKGKETGAAIVAVPVQESLKKVAGKQVAYSINRESVWLVQTPQVFQKDLVLNAYHQAFFNCITATDDSELVELLGHPIYVVKGSRTNIKITTPGDLKLAKLLIKKMR